MRTAAAPTAPQSHIGRRRRRAGVLPSVKVAELVIELVGKIRVVDGWFGGGPSCGRPLRHAVGAIPEAAGRERGDAVREQPGEPVEPAVEGGGQGHLATILLDEVVDDLLPRAPLVEQL